MDKNFIEKIEENLECVPNINEPAEVEANRSPLPFRPTFACIPEGRIFSFEDAKSTLLSNGIDAKVPSKVTEKFMDKPELKSTQTFVKSEFEKSRTKFVFVDLSTESEKDKKILVRDCDGSLRTPTSDEIKVAVEKTWNRNAPKLFK